MDTENWVWNSLFTSLSNLDPNRAKLESFQLYFFGFTKPETTQGWVRLIILHHINASMYCKYSLYSIWWLTIYCSYSFAHTYLPCCLPASAWLFCRVTRIAEWKTLMSLISSALHYCNSTIRSFVMSRRMHAPAEAPMSTPQVHQMWRVERWRVGRWRVE